MSEEKNAENAVVPVTEQVRLNLDNIAKLASAINDLSRKIDRLTIKVEANAADNAVAEKDRRLLEKMVRFNSERIEKLNRKFCRHGGDEKNDDI